MDKYIYRFYNWLKYKKFEYLIDPAPIYKFLQESQYWERKRLEDYQLTSLNDLLLYSKKSTYYNELLKDTKLPLDDLNKLKGIPILSKSFFQDNIDQFATGEYLKSGWFGRSSGSTGHPTIIYLSQLAMAYRNASKWRFFDWWGFSQYDRWINFTAYPRRVDTLKKQVKSYMTPRLDVDIFTINEENISTIFQNIYKFRPVYFRGYVSSLVQLGRFLKTKHINSGVLHLKCIIVTSEILYDSDREFIEEVFQCKVANEYGAAEAGLFAYECPSGGMHMQEESLLMYVNNDNELISTEFNNKLMPLINYKVGDKVFLSNNKCSCGRELRLIERIEGRIGSDEIITPDGRILNYLFFDRMIKNLGQTQLWGQIKKFQIIQENSTFYCIIVKMANYNKDIESYIESYIRNGIGNDIKIEFVYKDEILPDKSGKYRIYKRIVNV